ncbi:TRI36 [Hepatospora eriocheir]|uniref:TRI36 n=1 Tax=Hepatospora eriocheir TaxID=1081669 RepID=A0A1X0QIZ6_9MICR|nr:TRI36 [Hepatospora eriocheir]
MSIEKKIEYKIKFTLNSMTAKLIEIKDILAKDRIPEFKNMYNNSNKAQLFCSNINEETLFSMSTIPLDSKSTTHKVFLCEVAVGKPIFVNSDFIKQNLPIPSGYDSLVVGELNDEIAVDSKVDTSRYNYVIKDKNKILPLYEIVFEYDPEFEKVARNKNICVKCKRREAIMFCPPERASFCSACDNAIHKDEFLKRHERKYFAQVGQKKFSTCVHHTTKVVEYFCENCLEPLCSYCKINGSHASIEYAKHKIIPFYEACKSLSDDISESTNDVNAYRGRLENEIEKYNQNLKDFYENYEKIKECVEKEYKKTFLQLEYLKNNRQQSFNAYLIEMVKYKDTFKKMVDFPEEMDPTDKLQYYKAILHQRELENYPQYIVEPMDEIKIEGKLSIKATDSQEVSLKKVNENKRNNVH